MTKTEQRPADLRRRSHHHGSKRAAWLARAKRRRLEGSTFAPLVSDRGPDYGLPSVDGHTVNLVHD